MRDFKSSVMEKMGIPEDKVDEFITWQVKSIQEFHDKLVKFKEEKFDDCIRRAKAGEELTEEETNNCVSVIEKILKVPFSEMEGMMFTTERAQYEGLYWFVVYGQGSFCTFSKDENPWKDRNNE